MRQLLEDYKRKLKNLNEDLSLTINVADDIAKITRLTIKRYCYRTFISELERLIPKTEDYQETVISDIELARIKEEEFEAWKIENDKKNEKFMRDMDEQEAAEKKVNRDIMAEMEAEEAKSKKAR